MLWGYWSYITARPLARTGDVIAGRAPAFLRNGKERAMRRRSNQTISLEARLAAFAKTARKLAALLPPGAEKDELLRKARQADTMVHLTDWLNSPGPAPPR